MDRRLFVQMFGFGAGFALGSSPLSAARAFCTSGNPYWCSVGGERLVFRPNGRSIDLRSQSFECVAGAVVTEDDSLFLVDRERCRVVVQDQSGARLCEFGTPGSGPGQLQRPTDLHVIADRVYVCDPVNHRVQVFDLDGEFIRSIGKRNGGDRARPSSMNAPRAVTADSEGHLHVLDSDARIHVLSTDGERRGGYSGFGEGRGRMTCPQSMVARGRKILVADPGRGVVHAYDESGRFERSIETVDDRGRRVAPTWITARPDGSSYVCAYGPAFAG